MLTFVDGLGVGYNIPLSTLIVSLCVMLAVNIALYLFRSFGIYTLAKRRGIKYLWMAFMPILWIYLVGKIIGKVSMFNKKINFGLIAVIVIGIYQVLHLAQTILAYIPIVDLYFQGQQLYYCVDIEIMEKLGFVASQQYTFNASIFTVNPLYMDYTYEIITSIISITANILDIFNVILLMMLYVYLFRAYNPRNYFMFALLSLFFGIFGIFVFAIRKRQYVDYNEYMREQFQKMYAHRTGFMNNGENYQGGQDQGKDEPFKEYGKEEDSEPFDEFNDKN